MGVAVTDGRDLLRETARRVLETTAPRTALAEQEFRVGGDDRAVWDVLVSLGWVGLMVPVGLGGSGGTHADLAVLCEEMGRFLVPAPFMATAVAATAALERCGRPAAEELLTALAAGTRRPVLAVAEAGGSWAADGLTTRWERGVLTGEKPLVAAASSADALLVAAASAEGPRIIAVDRHHPGVTVTPLPAIDGAFLDRVTFDGVPGTALSDGWAPIDHALTRAAAMQAAWCAGGAAQLLDETVRYVTDRRQFGVPIGSFQAVQHRLADCAIAVAEASGLARSAALALDEDRPAGGWRRRPSSGRPTPSSASPGAVTRSGAGSATAPKPTCTTSAAGPKRHSISGAARPITSA